MMRTRRTLGVLVAGALAVALVSAVAALSQAARVSDIANTKHNLSVTGPGPVRATTESQI